MAARQGRKHWKDAASLILTAGRQQAQKSAQTFNYKVLMMQRSETSKFMPNATVFPGGILEDSDFNDEWLDIFGDAGIESFADLTEVKGPRPPVLVKARSTEVPNEVALRICAIRETFEESGILLARKFSDIKNAGVVQSAVWSSHENAGLGRDELRKWQQEVDQDSRQFITMCRRFEILPDVWSLSEWSNWLTPTSFGSGRRYDTIFFICCLDRTPGTAYCPREMVSAHWRAPDEALLLYRSKRVWFAPPQLYEISRLLNVLDSNELDRFHRQRNALGCVQWMPVLMACGGDNVLSLLPGDDRYPRQPDYEGTGERLQHDVTADDSNHSTPNKHCVIMSKTSKHSAKILVNISDNCGHFQPAVLSQDADFVNSQL